MERVDDLQLKGLRIIQNPDKFCFGTDAVLLSDFAKVKKGEKVLDIGTGTGIIPILLSAKTEGEFFTGVEIQEDIADMAKRSVELNHLDDRICIVCADINDVSLKDSPAFIPAGSVDVVTCNPPYMNDKGLLNDNEAHNISRHEIKCTLEDVIREGARALNETGRYYMINRPARLADAICTMRQYRLEPKRIRMVYPHVDKPANLVLIEAAKNSKSFMKVEEPLIVYNKDGSYTEEIYKIYGYDNGR